MQSRCYGTVELRAFRSADAPAFKEAVLESLATLGKWMPWAHPQYAEADALAWFQVCREALAAASAYEFGIFHAATGELLGGAGLNQFNRVHNFCNLGYWVRKSAQRQGVATAAAKALLTFAFGRLKVTRVEIVVLKDNLPSIGVARRAGGQHECLASNRLLHAGEPKAAHVFSFVPQAEA